MKEKIKNNDKQPVHAGYYETVDTTGHITFTYYNGNRWFSITGHPVEFWFNKTEPTDKEIENMLTQ